MNQKSTVELSLDQIDMFDEALEQLRGIHSLMMRVNGDDELGGVVALLDVPFQRLCSLRKQIEAGVP
jgi:hypothetical protein